MNCWGTNSDLPEYHIIFSAHDIIKSRLYPPLLSVTELFFNTFSHQKPSVDKQNCRDPGERKRMIQHVERGACLKYGKYPDDSECAGADNGAGSRVQGVSAAAEHSRRSKIYRISAFQGDGVNINKKSAATVKTAAAVRCFINIFYSALFLPVICGTRPIISATIAVMMISGIM